MRTRTYRNVAMAALGSTLVMGCYRGTPDNGLGFGTEGSGTADGGSDDGTVETPPENGGVGMVGLRRLSRTEMDHTLRDLLGDDTDPGTRFLPEDVIDPFDNDYTHQAVSTVLVESIETMANDVATRLVEDTTRRQLVVGCEPTGPADATCMEGFVARVGRMALRRPLQGEEIESWTQLGLDFAAQRSDFYEGVDTVLRVLLQHPNFIYRVEVGTPTEEPGVFRLDGYEVATRLSYFVWGTTPSEDLLDRAEAGELDSPVQVANLARTMLEDPRARERVDRFHAMWLGYYALPHDASLTTSMRQETRALLDDVIFDDPRSYLDVFAAGGSYVDDTLAELYGLPAPGSDDPTWVDYGETGRQGLLSHGSFLSVAARFGDTSPTQRGLLIRTRLLCQVIPPPPPEVDVDNPPEGGDAECKIDRYEEHRSNGACNGCHEQIDPVGFGLEQYDQMGRFRTAEADNPQCEITGEGRINGQPFSGPAGLADYVMDNDLLDACMVNQLYRMAMGHPVGFEDIRYVDDLLTRFREDGHRFDDLVLALVEDEAFSYRREED